MFICAAVTSTRTTFSVSNTPSNETIVDLLSLRDSTHGLAGWVIFGCFAVMIYEGVVIALRFLNLEVLSNYIGIFLITVSQCLWYDFHCVLRVQVESGKLLYKVH